MRKGLTGMANPDDRQRRPIIQMVSDQTISGRPVAANLALSQPFQFSRTERSLDSIPGGFALRVFRFIAPVPATMFEAPSLKVFPILEPSFDEPSVCNLGRIHFSFL